MNRREFVASVVGLLATGDVVAVPKPLLKTRYVKDLKKEEEFKFAGRMYRKLDDGFFTRNVRPDKVLFGDANVIEIETGKCSWVGPDCPINYDIPIKDGLNLTWDGVHEYPVDRPNLYIDRPGRWQVRRLDYLGGMFLPGAPVDYLT